MTLGAIVTDTGLRSKQRGGEKIDLFTRNFGWGLTNQPKYGQ